MNNNKLTFQQLLLRYMKRNKRKTDRQAILLTILLGFILIVTNFSSNHFIKTEDLTPIQAEDGAITLGLTGDIMLGRFVDQSIKRYGASNIFSGTGLDLTSLDYLTGNFEHPITHSDIQLDHKKREKIYLSVERDALDVIRKTDFTNVNLANNHMYDYEENGILHTIDTFSDAGIPFVGAGENRAEAYQIHYAEIKGKTIATLGFTDIYTRNALTGIETPGVATTNMKIMLSKIEEAKKYADIVITHIHWGTEYKTKQDKRQVQIAEVLAEAGVDIIIGHHPHVLQSVEVIDGTIVFYSLGNFVFDQGWSITRETVLPIITLQPTGEVKIQLHPMLIKEGIPHRLKRSEAYYRKRIFNRLKRTSSLNFTEEDGILYFNTTLQSETVKK